MKSRFYNFEKEGVAKANLYIYGDICSDKWWGDECTPTDFIEELNKLGDVEEIDVHINSYGGEVFAGFAIYNTLKQHAAKINVYIDGIAASAASIIAMAGDKIYMPKTSLMMIHYNWSYVAGNAKELRRTAEDMDKIDDAIRASYIDRVKIDERELAKLLDEETLMTADECIEKGFADEIVKDNEAEYAQNQYSNKTLLSIYNKSKFNNESKQEISEETISKIANKVIELQKVQNAQNNNYEKKDLQENKKSWESFFYTKNEEER